MATNHIDYAAESARYGNLARVAMNFHIQTGNPAELDAATCYARAGAYFARLHLDDWRIARQLSTCVETIDGDPNSAIRLSFQINVF